MPRPAQNAQISFDWLEPDPLTLAKLTKLAIDGISGSGRGEVAILLGCGKNKKEVRSSASELYSSPRFQVGVHLASRMHLPLFCSFGKVRLGAC